MWQKLLRPWRHDPLAETAAALYRTAATQARLPAFYAAPIGVPDDVDGRFDLLLLHVFLVVRRLRREGDAGAPLAQALCDALFADLDRGLRELGVGDMGLRRRMRVMAQAWGGRSVAYEDALAAGTQALEATLARNLYGRQGVTGAAAAALAEYVREADRVLAAQDARALNLGQVAFAPLPDPRSAETPR
ncbi:MAG: ubiquinol-cytochrome C chaperone [Alphaproteobacteria bacterium]|nr:ubiquinol-cytochrome C chaperone [Alphaproteobacteria bacterium]